MTNHNIWRLIAAAIVIVGLAFPAATLGAETPDARSAGVQQAVAIPQYDFLTSYGITLTDYSITKMMVSPGFAVDRTLFVEAQPSGTYQQPKLFKSTDAGRTWTTVHTNATCTVLSPAYPTDQTVYACHSSDGVVLRSTDGGNSWHEAFRFSIPNTIVPIKIALSPSYATDGTVFVAWTGSDNLLISRNWGNSWNWQQNAYVYSVIQELAFSPNYAVDRTVFAGGWGLGISKSTNGGDSWAWARGGIETDKSVIQIAVSPAFSTDQTLYSAISEISTRKHSLYRSTNGGDTWTKLPSPVVSDISTPSGGFVLDPEYPAAPFIYLVANSRLVISPDGGTSFLFGDNQRESSQGEIRRVALSPDGTVLFVGTAKGLIWMPARGVWKRTVQASAGGQIVGDAISVIVDFANDTLTEDANIVLTAQLPGNPMGLQGVGRFFELTATSSRTGLPAELAPGKTYALTVQYLEKDLGNAIEPDLALYYHNGSQWAREPTSTINTETNTITATPNHFSQWAVFEATSLGFRSCDTIAEIPKAECEALVALYDNTNGPGWTNRTGWLQTNTPCNWYGVTCQAGHVSELNLTRNQLIGVLPGKLGTLVDLQSLNLSSNQLAGAIPPELGNLANLRSVNLSSNQLTGAIPPELGNLANLQSVNLSSNQLSGAIPVELGRLTSLKSLYLGNNQLSGAIPPQLGDLVNLEQLLLFENRLTGSLPAELGNLTKLQRLYLWNNKFSGAIPPAFGSLASLQNLALYGNQLGGALPVELGDLTNLQLLLLSDNQLTGPVPSKFRELSSLSRFTIDRNPLSGPLPTELTALSLTLFAYDSTDLCEPGAPAFQTWLSGITDLRRTDVICGTQTINGSVWDDLNSDGSQDANEPPLPGLTVTLTANAGSLLSVAAGRQVITGADGGYHFGFVSPGAYTIAVTGPGGYLPTVPGPVDVTVPVEGDVTVPPIGLAEAPVHVWLPLIRK